MVNLGGLAWGGISESGVVTRGRLCYGFPWLGIRQRIIN